MHIRAHTVLSNWIRGNLPCCLASSCIKPVSPSSYSLQRWFLLAVSKLANPNCSGLGCPPLQLLLRAKGGQPTRRRAKGFCITFILAFGIKSTPKLIAKLFCVCRHFRHCCTDLFPRVEFLNSHMRRRHQSLTWRAGSLFPGGKMNATCGL